MQRWNLVDSSCRCQQRAVSLFSWQRQHCSNDTQNIFVTLSRLVAVKQRRSMFFRSLFAFLQCLFLAIRALFPVRRLRAHRTPMSIMTHIHDHAIFTSTKNLEFFSGTELDCYGHRQQVFSERANIKIFKPVCNNPIRCLKIHERQNTVR